MVAYPNTKVVLMNKFFMFKIVCGCKSLFSVNTEYSPLILNPSIRTKTMIPIHRPFNI